MYVSEELGIKAKGFNGVRDVLLERFDELYQRVFEELRMPIRWR